MHDVQKKKPRRPIHPVWYIILLLGMAGSLVTGIILTGDRQPVEVPGNPLRSKLLWQHDPETVTQIIINKKNGTGYSLDCRGGIASVHDDDDFPLNVSLINDIITNASLIEAEYAFTDGDIADATLPALGLEPAEITMKAMFSDGISITLLLGTEIPGEPVYFCMVQGNNEIYAISADVYESFSYDLAKLHRIPSLDIKADLIAHVKFTGIASFNLSMINGSWSLTDPLVYPAETNIVTKLLKSIESMRFVQWVGNADSLDLAQYGLDKPRMILSLQQVFPDDNPSPDATLIYTGPQNQRFIDLSIGADTGNGTLYCLYDSMVWTGSYLSMGFIFATGYEMLMLQSPFDIPVSKLNQLAVETDRKRAAYEISLTERVLQNNELETDEAGINIYDLVVHKDGSIVNSQAFEQAYSLLAAITASGRLPDRYEPVQDARMTITFMAGQTTRRVAFHAYDAFHDAFSINGVFVFYVRNDWADSFILP